MNSNTASTSGLGTLPSNTITNPKVDLKGITTRSGVAYQGPTIPTTSYSPPKVVERETEVTKDTVPPTNNGSTKDVQPPVVQVQSQVPNSEPVVAPVSAPKPNPKPSIPYPSRLNDQKIREKVNNQIENFYQIFQDLHFEISFADALILMPKFASTLKSLIGNNEKLSEMARTLLNEHCSAVLLKKLPEKLGDPDKFLIPCDFPGMDECTLIPIPRPNPNSRRILFKDQRALIDVYEGELTLRVGKEAVTFNLDQTSRYSSNYDDNSVNRIDVIEMACEEYSQEVLGFSDVIAMDFLPRNRNDAFLALEDDPTSPEVDHSYYDPEGDILLLEAFLNDDPSLPPPTQGNYLPEIQKELKVCEAKNDKSSIDEPPEVELKDLPPHLEYAFLEGDDKLPVIIAKDLSVEEKATLIKVLKSHKRAIAWKLSDIKGINPEFCTHKILMEEDYKPAVQHQRRVNPKIHDVIKKEVEKLLDAGLIYPISDSPWTGSDNRRFCRAGVAAGLRGLTISEDLGGGEEEKCEVLIVTVDLRVCILKNEVVSKLGAHTGNRHQSFDYSRCGRVAYFTGRTKRGVEAAAEHIISVHNRGVSSANLRGPLGSGRGFGGVWGFGVGGEVDFGCFVEGLVCGGGGGEWYEVLRVGDRCVLEVGWRGDTIEEWGLVEERVEC
ncbi:hypothetical protein Tco_0212776 [Tanacetum coccineum]